MIGRITQIMDREGLTSSKFAEEIGIQRSAMSHILNGRNNEYGASDLYHKRKCCTD